ncbi:unnamed protein product [Amoebophrya sp. A120]|nr:unnamed protein product [Amoebophrya sp. A120]|eukprot:GSA120T00025118001.1
MLISSRLLALHLLLRLACRAEESWIPAEVAEELRIPRSGVAKVRVREYGNGEDNFCFRNTHPEQESLYYYCCQEMYGERHKHDKENACWDATYSYEQCCRPVVEIVERREAEDEAATTSSGTVAQDPADRDVESRHREDEQAGLFPLHKQDGRIDDALLLLHPVEFADGRSSTGSFSASGDETRGSTTAAPRILEKQEPDINDIFTKRWTGQSPVTRYESTAVPNSRAVLEPPGQEKEALPDKNHPRPEGRLHGPARGDPAAAAENDQLSDSEYCWAPIRKLAVQAASFDTHEDMIENMLDSLQQQKIHPETAVNLRQMYHRLGGSPDLLDDVQLMKFCCAAPHNPNICFHFDAVTDNMSADEKNTDNGSLFGWNWPLNVDAARTSNASTANKLKMALKHADCCFPQLKKMLRTPLKDRPQWMLKGVDEDLRFWKRYYSDARPKNLRDDSTGKSAASVGAQIAADDAAEAELQFFDTEDVPAERSPDRQREGLQNPDEQQAATNPRGASQKEHLVHPLQHYGGRDYSVIDSDHPEQCELFVQFCPQKILGRSCAPAAQGKFYSWQVRHSESWQAAKLLQAWFLVARHMPAYDCEHFARKASEAAAGRPRSSAQGHLGVRFYHSMIQESLDLATGKTTSTMVDENENRAEINARPSFELPIMSWTRSIFPFTASDTALQLPTVQNFLAGWHRSYEMQMRLNYIPWKERRPEFFFRGVPAVVGAEWNWTRLYEQFHRDDGGPGPSVLEDRPPQMDSDPAASDPRGVYFRRFMRDDERLWRKVQDTVRETGDWPEGATESFLRKLDHTARRNGKKRKLPRTPPTPVAQADDYVKLRTLLRSTFQLEIEDSSAAGIVKNTNRSITQYDQAELTKLLPSTNSPRAVLAKLAHRANAIKNGEIQHTGKGSLLLTAHDEENIRQYPFLFSNKTAFSFDIKATSWPRSLEFNPIEDFALFPGRVSAEKALPQILENKPESFANREAWNAFVHRNFEAHFEKNEGTAVGEKYFSELDQVVYKYNFNDNVSLRDIWSFLAGQVLFRAHFRYDNQIDKIFQPYEHYIPVRRDLKDFYDKLNFIVANDHWAEKIADRGKKLGQEVFNLETKYWYMHTLILKLALIQGGHTEQDVESLLV